MQQNDTISVAFVDMQMLQMNGLELLTQIRNAGDERLAMLPVIVIAGADSGGSLTEIEVVKTPAAVPEPDITEALVNEAMQHVITGDFSSIPDYLLLPVAERLTLFLEFVNSRSGQRLAAANATGERI